MVLTVFLDLADFLVLTAFLALAICLDFSSKTRSTIASIAASSKTGSGTSSSFSISISAVVCDYYVMAFASFRPPESQKWGQLSNIEKR